MNRLILFFSLVVFTLSSYAQNWNDLFNQFQEITNNKQWDLALEKGEFLKKETEKKFTKNHANYSTVLSWIGYVYKNKNNFETAEKLYVEALDILNKVKPQDPSFFIFANQDLAYFYYDNKKFKEAIPFYEALLKILQKPGINNSYWSYYIDLAQCYYNTSNTDLGITFYSNLEKNINDESLKKLTTLAKIQSNLGNLYSHAKNPEKAVFYLSKSLEHCRSNYPNCAVPLENLANHYIKNKQPKEALPLYLESFTLQSQQTQYNRFYQLLLENIAFCYLDLNDKDNFKKFFLLNCEHLNNFQPFHASGNYNSWRKDIKSKGDYELDLFILENQIIYLETKNPEHADYPFVLYNVGMNYWNQSNFLKAEVYYKKAVDYNLKKNNHTENINRSLKSYTKILLTNNKYNEAKQWFNKRETFISEKFDKTSLEYGIFLIDEAKLQNKLNELDLALQKIEQAENILKNHQVETETTLEIIQAKADIFTDMNQHQKAAPLLAKGLEISEKNNEFLPYQIMFLTKISDFFEMANDYDGTISLLSNNIEKIKNFGLPKGIIEILYSRLAFAYYRKGDFTTAEKIYQNILPIFDEVFGKNNVYYRNALNQYGMLLSQTGQHQKALEAYLAIEKHINQLSQKDQATFLFNLASVYKDLKNNEQAINNYRKFLDLYLAEINDNFLLLSESEKENYMMSVAHNYHHLFNFYHHLSDKSQVLNDMYRLHSSFRGMILNASLDVKKQWEILDNPEAISLIEQFQAQKLLLSQLLLSGNSSQVDEMQNKIDALERELSRKIPDYQTKKVVSTVGFDGIKKQLTPGEVVLDFVQFEMGTLFEWYNNQQYGVFVISNDATPKYVSLFNQNQLNEVLKPETARENANQLYRGSIVAKSTQNNNYGAKLYDLIWRPLEAFVRPQQAVYYVPSGSLHQLALAAIPVNKERVLMEEYKLLQRNSTKNIKIDKETNQSFNYLLFGGIDYNANQNNKPPRSNIWSYLEGTKNELDALSEIIKTNKNTWQGSEATEKVFKAQVSNNQPKIIHIATHGFFYSKPDKKLANGTNFNNNTQWEIADNPMMRSGLLFAGANHNWQESDINISENDGIATALEINNLNMKNTQLVVLSACETGLGDISGSEGVYGLQRAFKNAGAQYLLMSLWKVPDAETAEFMTHFYQNLTENNNIELSFQNTQKFMKNKYPKDPYNWAAFVLVK